MTDPESAVRPVGDLEKTLFHVPQDVLNYVNSCQKVI